MAQNIPRIAPPDWDAGSILGIVANIVTNISGSVASKMDEYNDILRGRMITDDPNADLYIEKEHLDFINVLKGRGQYERVLDFSKIYMEIPYQFRFGVLLTFFTTLSS
jgi:hypothetical protein